MRDIGKILLIAGIILSSAYAFLIFHTGEKYCPDCTVGGHGIRFFQDNYDRGAYYVRGSWYHFGMENVGKLDSEYPALAVYVFALPFAVADLMGRSDPAPRPGLILNLFTAMMVIFYLGLMLITRRLLEEKGKDTWRLVVFLLPGFLYFSLNRYDVMPALLVSAAVFMVLTDRPLWAGVLLGMGMMVKWYPALLGPICFAYFWRWKRSDAFILTGAFAATVIALSIPLLMIGGVDAFFDPYRFQIGRDADAMSIFGLATAWTGETRGLSPLSSWAKTILLALQLVIPLLALLGAQKSSEAFLDWVLLSLFAFIFFAKFYSPQWIIWIIPLFIVRYENRWLIVLIVAWDLLSYMLFPVLYDVYNMYENTPGVVFVVAVLVKTALILMLAYGPAVNVWRDLRAFGEEALG